MKFACVRSLALKSILFVIVLSHICLSQSIPVPEYYGIYAYSNGHLVKLDSAGGITGEKTVAVRLGQRNAVGNVVNGQPAVLPATTMQAVEFPADLKLVVYIEAAGLTSPMAVAGQLHLESLVYVKTVNVDTGFPNNIHRSGQENGWDTGDAAEFVGAASGDHAQSLELLIKPMPGQKDAVIAGLAKPLQPGVYRLTLGQNENPFGAPPSVMFAVQPIADGEASQCVNASVSYMMMMSKTAYSRCGGAAPASTSAVDGGGSSPGVSVPSTGCSDYDGCFKAGIGAFGSKDLNSAEADFRAATKFSPNKDEAWRWVGTVMLGNNEVHQVGELANVWDKALSLGGPLIISACHERTMQPCERGDLWLSSKMITFRARGAQLFSTPPNGVEPGKVFNNSGGAHISYSLKTGGKSYSFDFVPSSWQNCNFNMMVQCQPDGIAEQLILANYVSQTLPKLVGGQFAVSVASTTPAPAAATKAASGPTGCAVLSGAGYSILLQSHLYKVIAGSTKQPYFLNESGSQVTDASLLSQLASVVWTHDNILPDARNASGRVSDILSTSKAIQRYTASQDLIARAMVEAMEGAATDGASLVKAPANLTVGFLKSQITNAPRNILTDTAQVGLNQSLSLYKQMESVPLPPADATVLNASDMLKILTLYTQAHTLDLPYSALAAKLMPQHTQDLTDAGLKSIISELTAGPVFAGSPTAAVTTSQLLLLQTSLANLANGNVALQAFHDNLNLAVNLNKADSSAIDRMASGASAQQCKP